MVLINDGLRTVSYYLLYAHTPQEHLLALHSFRSLSMDLKFQNQISKSNLYRDLSIFYKWSTPYDTPTDCLGLDRPRSSGVG